MCSSAADDFGPQLNIDPLFVISFAKSSFIIQFPFNYKKKSYIINAVFALTVFWMWTQDSF